MALSLNTQLKQTQRLAMTQALRQQIEMLQLSTVELAEVINEELETNPVLDLDEDREPAHAASEGDPVSGDLDRELSHDQHEAEIISRDLPDDINYNEYPGDDDRKRQFIENAVAHETTLSEYLLEQARMLPISSALFTLVERIITALDENGFLSTEKAVDVQDPETNAELFAEALKQVQSLEPTGCGARDVRESLLIQSRAKYPDDTLLAAMIEHHFDHVSSLMYEKIAKPLGVSIEEVKASSRQLQSLNPYPGRGFAHVQTKYIVPDIDVRLVDGEVLVSFNDEWIPRLRISSKYLDVLSQKDADKKLKNYVRERIASAKQLMKNIEGRRETIDKVVRAVMQHQIDFLEKGPGHLKPLTCAQVADIVQCHESTVSRVSSGKYMQCSWGTFEIKSFFVSKLGSDGDDAGASSDEALSKIAEIVAKEDPKAPYSDDVIAEMLLRDGVTVARRTVSKYRDILNIPSSSKRKRLHILKTEGGST
jgi:RNA polymerase sigma-54 factor